MRSRQDGPSANPIDGERRVWQAFALAMALPMVMIAACALARSFWPSTLGQVVRLDTLLVAGFLGYLLGVWRLYTLRLAKVRWAIALVTYDIGMPMAVFGMALLAEASHGGR